MPVTATPASAPPPDPELLPRLAEILLSADDDPGVAEAAWLVKVEPVAESAASTEPGGDDPTEVAAHPEAPVSAAFDLGLLALDAGSGHPADLLRGFVAPPEWWAVGVLAVGSGACPSRRARPPDRGRTRRRLGPRGRSGAGAPRPPRGPQR